MQLQRATRNMPLFREGMDFLATHDDTTPPSWQNDPYSTVVWVLQGDGGRFDEVTEEMTDRPVAAVLAVQVSDYNTRVRLAVHPDHRHRGWGRRMLRRLLTENYGYVTAEVNPTDRATMRFAVNYGTIVQYTRDSEDELWAVVQLTLEQGWPHGQCGCSDCRHDLSLLGSRDSSRRPSRAI